MLDEAEYDVNISLGDDWVAGFTLQFEFSDADESQLSGAKLGNITLTAEQAKQLLEAIG